MTNLDSSCFRTAEESLDYTWSDEGNAIAITIPIECDVKPSGVDVNIAQSSIRAGIKGKRPVIQVHAAPLVDGGVDGGTVRSTSNGIWSFFQGALYKPIDVSESIWQIERGKKKGVNGRLLCSSRL